MQSIEKREIFVVDDDRFVLDSVTLLLRSYGFIIRPFQNPREALIHFIADEPELLLTDINMPEMTGIELLEKIRLVDRETPVILMTAYGELDTAVSAIQKGAFDFIIKPYSPPYLIHAIEKALNFRHLSRIERNYKKELEQTVELRTGELNQALETITQMSREIIERLTAAAELRDEDTGAHITRIGRYAGILAQALGLSEAEVEQITLAGAMHDVGKIGIPDSILLKPERLTPEEFSIIKQHTVIGERILHGSQHPLLQLGATIALSHHERWDGSGYPHGLQRDEIPLPGRIVMIADHYDALRSRRVYKPPFDHQTSCRIILEGDGRTMPHHFDPEILQVFCETQHELESIFDDRQVCLSED